MKGYVYTLEMLIALSFILVTVFAVMREPPGKPDFETGLIKREGFEALDYLNARGSLREWAASGNASALEGELAGVLPKSLAAKALFCTSPCRMQVPENATVVSVDYYIAGYRDAYLGTKVKLWMWRAW